MATAGADFALLQPAFVAALGEPDALALGLPPATRLALHLEARGLIHKDGFIVEQRWTSTGGVPARVSGRGARLTTSGRDHRLPELIYSTLAAVAEVNSAADLAARQRALSRLKRAIGQEGSGRISPDGVISGLSIAYAAGFSLSLKASSEGFDFDPVLFARERIADGDDGALIVETDDSLLPPELAPGFVRRFRGGDGQRGTYLLDDGTILYIDPDLQRVLPVIRAAQAGSV